MTGESLPTQFSIAELGARFGEQLAPLYAQIITLEKQLAAQAMTIQGMGENEITLVDHIHDLEKELADLKAVDPPVNSHATKEKAAP